VLTVLYFYAKFQVTSFNRSRDIGGLKIPKVGHSFWPNFVNCR